MTIDHLKRAWPPNMRLLFLSLCAGLIATCGGAAQVPQTWEMERQIEHERRMHLILTIERVVLESRMVLFDFETNIIRQRAAREVRSNHLISTYTEGE